jgi:hypothetical protein
MFQVVHPHPPSHMCIKMVYTADLHHQSGLHADLHHHSGLHADLHHHSGLHVDLHHHSGLHADLHYNNNLQGMKVVYIVISNILHDHLQHQHVIILLLPMHGKFNSHCLLCSIV